jgi:hypothetical protein
MDGYVLSIKSTDVWYHKPMNLATPVSSGTSWNAAPKTSLFNFYDSLRLMRIFYRRHITIDDAIDSNALYGYHFFDAFTPSQWNSSIAG